MLRVEDSTGSSAVSQGSLQPEVGKYSFLFYVSEM